MSKSKGQSTWERIYTKETRTITQVGSFLRCLTNPYSPMTPKDWSSLEIFWDRKEKMKRYEESITNLRGRGIYICWQNHEDLILMGFLVVVTNRNSHFKNDMAYSQAVIGQILSFLMTLSKLGGIFFRFWLAVYRSNYI